MKSEIEELWPTRSYELLKALHILTRDGKLNQDSRRKLKQVKHLLQLITPHLDSVKTLADMGAGKSYLGFLLYDLWMRDRPESRLWAVEQRAELVESCKKIAKDSGFERIHFAERSISDAIGAPEIPSEIDAVLALHACDTATDDAIHFALEKKAQVIALVPCCQAELARLLDRIPKEKVPLTLSQLWRHNLHRREFGSHLSNVVRCLYLESHGYKVIVTELIGWEHSLKNELIIAIRSPKANEISHAQLKELARSLPLEEMKLLQGKWALSN